MSCFTNSNAQKSYVRLKKVKDAPIVNIYVGDKIFTSFFFPDTIAKQVLYPISAPNGTIVTRGFPVDPRPDEPTDHPHHLGLWLNYESVNGLDFWNNSYAIPADRKKYYGTIRFDKITKMKDGKSGLLNYESTWNDYTGKSHLKESTEYVFSEIDGSWVVDRTTTLKALIPVLFKDVKDGFLGFRAAHELQIPAVETKKYTDANGIETIVKAVTDKVANGNYINSNGIQGDDVWSKKASWCMMYGKMGADSISVLIIDHPQNVGYPTNWHARGYGLFAANPLGESVFTNGKAVRNLKLETGEAVTFKYRIVIASGKELLNKEAIGKLENDFSSK